MLKAAEESHTDCIDLCSLTRDALAKMGEPLSKELFMNFDAGIYENYPEGMKDNTHLRMKGAEFVTSLFLEAIRDNEKMKEYFHV